MPSFRWHRTKEWMARKHHPGGREECLGFFTDYEEAICVEYDHGRPLPKGKICDCEMCVVKPRG